jgi:DNA (cytosine-5)-methyltransferase 1
MTKKTTGKCFNVMANQQSLNELALFAGAGGGILGGKLLGWRTVCAVEWEQYPASVLCARQNDGLLPPFPIWDDVQTFDGKPWRGIVDVVSGGFPCQDISAAGKGAGIDGERSGMWGEMARIIYEVRPKFVFVENSPMLTSRGLGRVLGDLAAMGFDAKWGVLGAADVGANHQRDRIWIVGKLAYTSQLFSNGSNDNSRVSLERKKKSEPGDNCGSQELANSTSLRQSRQRQHEQCSSSKTNSYRQANITKSIGFSDFWATEPNVGRVADGVAARVDRLKAIGNGQVPLCAATAWRILNDF